MRRALPLSLAALISGAACSSERQGSTEVLLEIDAEEQVRARLASLRVQIRGGGPDDAYADYTGDESAPLRKPSLPLHVGLMPRHGDAQRRYLVSVTAYDEQGQVLTEGHLAGGYVPGALRFAAIVLEDVCLPHEPCTSDEGVSTCRQGACVDALLPPEDLAADPKHPSVVAAGPAMSEEPDAEPGSVDGGPEGASDAAFADASDAASDAVAEAGSCLGECKPGQQEMLACGNCGTRVRTCSERCQWGTFGACDHQGVCKPGAQEPRTCGNCGTAMHVCTDSCAWNPIASCSNSGECPANVAESESCGNCGTRTRACNASCGWGQYESCTGEGPCAPGAVSTRACGKCGTQSQTCAASCTWSGFGACENEKECAAGEQRGCNLGISGCAPGVQTCTAACGWGPCQATCNPVVVVQAGDNNGPYGCGPNCCSGTDCSWVVGATCPAGTTRHSFAAGNPGGRGSCSASWRNSNPADPSCVLSSRVNGTDGTHCSITIQCKGP